MHINEVRGASSTFARPAVFARARSDGDGVKNAQAFTTLLAARRGSHGDGGFQVAQNINLRRREDSLAQRLGRLWRVLELVHHRGAVQHLFPRLRRAGCVVVRSNRFRSVFTLSEEAGAFTDEVNYTWLVHTVKRRWWRAMNET